MPWDFGHDGFSLRHFLHKLLPTRKRPGIQQPGLFLHTEPSNPLPFHFPDPDSRDILLRQFQDL
jgi:hypothetical protein